MRSPPSPQGCICPWRSALWRGAWGERVADFPSLGPAPHCGWDAAFDGEGAGEECCGDEGARRYPSSRHARLRRRRAQRSPCPPPRHPALRAEDAKAPTPSSDGVDGRIVLDEEEDVAALILENEQLRRLVAAGRFSAAQVPRPSVHRGLRGAARLPERTS